MILNYYDLALKDQEKVISCLESKFYFTSLGADAHQSVEKYLKYIVYEFDVVKTVEEEDEKCKILKTHNLPLILKYIESKLNIKFEPNFVRTIKSINGLYFSTRYPDEYIELEVEELLELIDILKIVKKTIDNLILELT